MCLEKIFSEEDKETLLNKHSGETITAYKVALIEDSWGKGMKLWPPFKQMVIPAYANYYRRTNTLEVSSPRYQNLTVYLPHGRKYKAYFHFFLHRDDAETFLDWILVTNMRQSVGYSRNYQVEYPKEWEEQSSKYKIVECLVNKQTVTTFGTEQICWTGTLGQVIIAREFELVGENEYVKEEVVECV